MTSYKTLMRIQPVMLLAASLLIVVTSCKKENATKAAHLTRGAWVLQNFETREMNNGTAKPWVNAYDSVSCQKDNTIIYKANGSYEINEGSLRCSNFDPQFKDSGNWKFLLDDTRLEMELIRNGQPVGSAFYDIVVLDKHTLQVTQRGRDLSYTPGAGVSYHYEELRWTYSH